MFYSVHFGIFFVRLLFSNMLKARILLAIWFYLFNTSTYNSHIYTYVYITKSETMEKTEFSMNTEHLVITPKTATIIEFVRAQRSNKKKHIHTQALKQNNRSMSQMYQSECCALSYSRFVTFPTHESFVFVSILFSSFAWFFFWVFFLFNCVIETNMWTKKRYRA